MAGFSVLSTNCQPNSETPVSHWQKNGSRVDVPCPESVRLYKQFMGGVDENDQLWGYYAVRTESMKCYKYIFWFLWCGHCQKLATFLTTLQELARVGVITAAAPRVGQPLGTAMPASFMPHGRSQFWLLSQTPSLCWSIWLALTLTL